MNKQLVVIAIAVVLSLFTGFMPMYLAYSSQSDRIRLLEESETELVKTNAAMIEQITALRNTNATDDCD